MKASLRIVFLLLIATPMASFRWTTEPAASRLTEYQKNVIYYFQEVALGFEYGTAPQITRKWAGPMRVFVEGAGNVVLEQELASVVDELNGLVSDDFSIEIVKSRTGANFLVYFGSPSEYRALYPEDSKFTYSNSGIYRVYWNGSNQITRGRMFVNTVSTGVIEQRSVLREELTQSLGLGRDSELVQESIFQSRYTTPTTFADIDREVIRLLYHPRVTTGLSRQEVAFILTEILLDENEARAFN